MLLACLVSLIFLLLACGSAQTYPATVEFDVVFPLNDTYAPAALFPIVFAIQNPQASVPLTLSIEWYLGRVGSSGDWLAGGFGDLPWINFSTNPYFVVMSTTTLNNTEGVFSLLWTLYSGNCSESLGGTKLGSGVASNHTRFTIKNGAQQPSLVTSSDTCPAQNVTFNVTGTLPVSGAAEYGERDICAVVAEEPPPPANPCAIQVDDVMASSMSAILPCVTAYPIWSGNCTSTVNSSSLAIRSSFGGMGLTWVATCLWLSLLFWVL
ncbi:hypothetical protein OIDMADRAFT_147705 [Oidiodendron maius Zn]|uniref:DUF7136 domain-containing protein n=1 Tax=Oidiodendron maius (strain Zn) TaxID=913774 RepID=A0A0C3CE34_OIDMZ|nr:hypothetical protein OIDMADRAFT_147705 [Oidiodendron maius Zn]